MKRQRRLSEDTLKKVERVVDRLAEDNSLTPVIVEGRRDVRALRLLGLEGEIFHMNTGKSILKFSEYISSKYREVIILTDFDRKGEELMKKLRKLLENEGAVCHVEYWYLLRTLLGSEISEIEEITSAVNI